MATLKKTLEDESSNHEASLQEMRHKHMQEISSINEQLENFKKVKGGLEKAKQTLEAENADLATELRNVNQSRQENDRRRKQAETQIAELQVSWFFFNLSLIISRFVSCMQLFFIVNFYVATSSSQDQVEYYLVNRRRSGFPIQTKLINVLSPQPT